MLIDLSPEETSTALLDCLQKNYGISGGLERLGGENLNFLVSSGKGKRWVLKIVDDDMPPEVVEMEFAAIEYAISVGIDLEIPRIIKNRQGNIETGIKLRKNERYRARLLSFIDGKVLEKVCDISDKLFENVGKSLSDYNLAMEDFDHPAAHRSHRWDLAAAGQHKDKTRLVGDQEKRDLLDWAFESWEQQAAPYLAELPAQFIHADANRENLLVKGDKVVGLLDFGDACINPTVCEVAICLAYMMLDQDQPLRVAKMVLDGYLVRRSFTDLEQKVLMPLVCSRLAVSISVAAKRRLIDPEHPNWFGSDELAWQLLARLQKLTPQEIKILF